jgi:hypothetical protein
MSGYTCWTEHGEHKEIMYERHPSIEEDQGNNMVIKDNGVTFDNGVDDLDEMLHI